MNVKDYKIEINGVGYALVIAPIADEHFEAASFRKQSLFQLKDGIREARKFFKCPVGFLKLGDELEYDRSSFTEKLQACGKPSDRAGHEKMGKELVERIKDNYSTMFKKNDIKLAAVAGNHKIGFTVGHKELEAFVNGEGRPYLNSSHMLADRLGFPYMGDGHCKINLHISHGSKRRIYKILVLHGTGAGSSAKADITEFQRIRSMYGDLDLIIKAHSHKPMTTHWGRFDTDFVEGCKEIQVEETTIINVGSMRGSMVMGHTDYGEKAQYTPIPTRFPLIALKVNRHSKGMKCMGIRAIPITF